MIFNSLFNLIETDTDGVYKFICRIFYERGCELGIADKLYVFAMVKKFKDLQEKNEEHFLELFENKRNLLKVVNQILGEGNFNFFTNGKDIKFTSLNEDALNLAYIYAVIFGISNIENPEESFSKKVSSVSC